MESSGKEGMIQVSETTKNILESAFPNRYRFEKNEDVEIKSLGVTIGGYLIYYNDSE